MTIRNSHLLIACAILWSGTFASLRAADPQMDAMMKRMRETLRTTMTQLQTSEADRAAAQTQLAESEQRNKDLTAQIEALNKRLAEQAKQMAEEKAAADKTAGELNDNIAKRTQELALVNEALAKWKQGYTQVAGIAREKDAERSRLASRVIVLDRQVADRERQNIELFKTGTEILGRYEDFSLGRALLAREPFVGTTRVKLQTEIQDYKDKLLDAKAKPGEKSAAAASVAKTTDAPTKEKKQ